MAAPNTPAQPKSRLLATFFEDRDSTSAKQLASHIQSLLTQLTPEMRESCLNHLAAARQARTREAGRQIVEVIARGSKNSAERARVENSLAVLSFFADALLSEDLPLEDYNDWSADLLTLGWIDEQSTPVLNDVLKKLTHPTFLSTLSAHERHRRAEAGVLPVFVQLGITVEARGVRKAPYRWGIPLSGPKAYKPEITGAVLIASVHIGVDEGFPEDFYFQMDAADIDNLLASFTAAKMEMDALRQYLRLDDERKATGDA
jgi:hypothetical protein